MCVLSVAETVSTRIFAIPILISFLSHRSTRKSEFFLASQLHLYVAHLMAKFVSGGIISALIGVLGQIIVAGGA
jgi:hypothetical protein